MTYRITNRDGDPRVETLADGRWHVLPIDGQALAADLEIQLSQNEVRILPDPVALRAIQNDLEVVRYEIERDQSQHASTSALLQRHAVAILRRMWRGEAKAS